MRICGSGDCTGAGTAPGSGTSVVGLPAAEALDRPLQSAVRKCIGRISNTNGACDVAGANGIRWPGWIRYQSEARATAPDHGEALRDGVGAVGGARGWTVRARITMMIMCCRSTGYGSTDPGQPRCGCDSSAIHRHRADKPAPERRWSRARGRPHRRIRKGWHMGRASRLLCQRGDRQSGCHRLGHIEWARFGGVTIDLRISQRLTSPTVHRIRPPRVLRQLVGADA